jgi:hypothetical protein
VTSAVNFSAEGLEAAPFTYPGQSLADVAVSAGAEIVVLPPESQVMVPPVARVAALNGCELPPVSPPLHPETVIMVDPVMVLQVMLLLIQVKARDFSAVIEPSVPMHTSPVDVAGRSMPSPVSPVTDVVKLSALGLEVASLT